MSIASVILPAVGSHRLSNDINMRKFFRISHIYMYIKASISEYKYLYIDSEFASTDI
jgi:hypothetical protein